MIHVQTLVEAEAIFRCAYIIFMSRSVSDQLRVACIEMENHINTFQYEVDELVDELENSKSSTQRENACQEHNNDNEIFHKEQSECQRFWRKMIEKVECALNLGNVKDTKSIKNKYYCPELMNYVQKTLLPTITLWSHTMWGDLSRFSKLCIRIWLYKL